MTSNKCQKVKEHVSKLEGTSNYIRFISNVRTHPSNWTVNIESSVLIETFSFNHV